MNKILYVVFVFLLALIIAGSIYCFYLWSSPSSQIQPTSIQSRSEKTNLNTSLTSAQVNLEGLNRILWSEEIILSPLAQKEFENKDEFAKHFGLWESGYAINSKTLIQTNIALCVKTTEKTPKEGSSGFIIDNNLSGNDLKRLVVAYNPEYKNWFTSYYTKETRPEYIESLYNIPYGPASRFSLMIDGEGKIITIVLTDGRIKKFNLKESFYSKRKELYFKIQTAPFSSVVVSEFAILTPL